MDFQAPNNEPHGRRMGKRDVSIDEVNTSSHVKGADSVR